MKTLHDLKEIEPWLLATAAAARGANIRYAATAVLESIDLLELIRRNPAEGVHKVRELLTELSAETGGRVGADLLAMLDRDQVAGLEAYEAAAVSGCANMLMFARRGVKR